MRFYLPEIGERIQLTQDWTFSLWEESRNNDFIRSVLPEADPINYPRDDSRRSWPYTLPAGTVLSVARIYIRAGVSSFSSVTFSIPGRAKAKFWAKLLDVNQIEFEAPSADAKGKSKQAWWAGAVQKLRNGETVALYPPGFIKAGGFTFLPRKDATIAFMGGRVVAAAQGSKLVIGRLQQDGEYQTGHVMLTSMTARGGQMHALTRDIIGYAATDLEKIVAASQENHDGD
jgi:hypothetical protein